MGKAKRSFFYLVQWLLIIAAVAICLRVFVRPVPVPDRRTDEWRSWNGFYALSYGAIMHGATGNEVSPELLKSHFEALRKAGYQTVSPDDVARYEDGRHALPEKPLLLMFEGGRKDTVLNVTPLLRDSGFVATACINTGACESRDRFYLTSSEVSDLTHQPHWYLGSMGHRALSHLRESSPTGTEAHFLTGRLHENGVPESDTALVVRVMQDYATSANFLGNLAGVGPSLFLYPYGDCGLGREADPLAAKVNRMGVELLFRVAFVEARDPYNGPTRDRYALTRLRVDGRMTASALVDRLDRSKPPRRDPQSPVASDSWVFSSNARQSAGRKVAGEGQDQILLEAGMAAWIAGSGDWTNSEICSTVKFDHSAVAGIYARYTEPEQCLYLSVAATGIRLQERSKAGSYATLLDRKAKLEPGRGYKVRLRVKQNRAFVFVDGQPVGQSIPLATTDGRGRTGVGSNGGTSVFLAVTAGPLPRVFIVSKRYRTLSASLRESALAFLPDLATGETQTPGPSPCLGQTQVDEMMAAASEGVEPIPLVSSFDPPSPDSPGRCTRLVDFVPLKPVVRRLAFRGPGFYRPGDVAEGPVAPVRVLPANQVSDWMSSGQDTGKEIILVEGGGPEVLAAIRLLLHSIPPQRLVAGSVEQTGFPPDVGTAVYPRSSD